MKIRLRYLLPVLILAAAGMGYQALANRAVPPETTAAPARPLEAEVRLVRYQTVRPEISAYGTVAPATEATLVAEVSGRVVRVADALVAGGVFRKGEVMMEVEAADYKTAVAEAAALENAERNLSRTRIRAPYTGLVTRRDVALGGYVSAGGPVAALAGLDTAEIRLLIPASDAALLDLPETGHGMPPTEHGRYKNPGITFKGKAKAGVGEKQTTTGNRESDGKKNNPAAEKTNRAKTNRAKTNRAKTKTIPCTRAKGQEVRITLTGRESAPTWTGRIVRTEGTIDPETRLICVVVKIEDPYGIFDNSRPLPQLLFGSFVTAKIKGAAVENAVALDPHLVGEDGRVWTVSRENRLRLKSVNVLRREQNRVIVTGGLLPGERLSKLRFPEGMEGRSVIARANDNGTGQGTATGKGKGKGASTGAIADIHADSDAVAHAHAHERGDRS